MTDKRYCSRCKTIKNLMPSPYSRAGNGSYMCRSCNTERCRKYRQTKKGKQVFRAMVKRSIKKHYSKHQARQKLRYAIEKGLVTKPIYCESCDSLGKIDGHHFDYSKPLEVKWLCRGCHADLHRSLVLVK